MGGSCMHVAASVVYFVEFAGDLVKLLAWWCYLRHRIETRSEWRAVTL